MQYKHYILSAMGAAVFVLAPAASAAVIVNPGDTTFCGVYDVCTTKKPITVADFTLFSSVTAAGETATFSNPLDARTVPASWATWSSAPFSESATPRVGFNTGSTLTITLAPAGERLFGFELEPNNFGTESITVAWFNGATPLFSETLSVNGTSGARLFAWDTGGANAINRITVTDNTVGNTGFALGQFREAVGATGIPEPGTLTLLGMGGALLFVSRKLRRRV